MNIIIWFRKEILKQVDSTKYGGLEIGCYCYNHMKHSMCDDDKCHNGFDKEMKEAKRLDSNNRRTD